ncbi:Flavinator of succinate dehydrogenase-domain-containing protein [Melampsora americana]|nr:Flavinator of succinate dehydrogenase-domain-containing protein [Melampsora americana]
MAKSLMFRFHFGNKFSFSIEQPTRIIFNSLSTMLSLSVRRLPLHRLARITGLSSSKFSTSKFSLTDPPDSKLHPIFAPSKEVTKPSFGSDPYPIPLQSPLHHTRIPEKYELSSKQTDFEEPVKLDESIECLRARLVYQSRKRGIVEMELLLSTFIDGGKLEEWNLEQLQTYDRFLKLPDWDIYYYVIKKLDPPSQSEWKDSKLVNELRIHTANRAKQIRKMPSLSTNNHIR